MADSYIIPCKTASFELIEKRSRFLAVAIPVESREEVLAELAKLREAHPKANHVCCGFVAGAPTDAQNWGFSDDGEPSGTAGKPILNVLQHSGIGCVLVAVVRYFGGVKLGTGGLVRAYGSATKKVLDQLETCKFEVRVPTRLCCGFENETRLRHELSKAGVVVEAVSYTEEVCLDLKLTQTQAARIETLMEERWFFKKPLETDISMAIHRKTDPEG